MTAIKTDVRMPPRLRNRLEAAALIIKATPDTAKAIDTGRIELRTCRRPGSFCTAGTLQGSTMMNGELDQSRGHPDSERLIPFVPETERFHLRDLVCDGLC